MFPIRDHNPSQGRPVVTMGLIVLNVLVFVLSWTLQSDPAATHQFLANWAMIPARISMGDGYATLISSMFIHGGLLHIGGNMLFLWVFGDNLEDELGHLRFLIFYLAAGVLGSLMQVLVDPHSTLPTIGASGAVAGVMGGYLLLFPRARVDVLFIFIVFFRIFPIPAWVVLGVWFALQLFSGVGSDISGGGVAYWAHVGGFAAGFLFILPLWLARGGPGFWQRSSGRPPHPDAVYTISRSHLPKIRRRK